MYQAQPPKRPQSLKPPQPQYIPKIDIKVEGLPSKSLPYPEGAEIKYRAYTFGEVKVASQSKMNHKDTFDVLLNGIEASFDKTMLTLQDLLFIGFLRKMSTFGDSKISASVDCSKCDHKNSFEIDTENDLEFTDISVEELPVIAELDSGVEMEFSPITAKDFLGLVSKGKDLDDIDFMAVQCRNYDFKTAKEIIFNASAWDAKILTEVDKLMHHGLKPVVRNCSECGEEIEIKLDSGGTDHQLVLPFRASEKSVSSRIRIGKGTSHKPT